MTTMPRRRTETALRLVLSCGLPAALCACATRAVSPGPLLADMPMSATGTLPAGSVAERTVALFAQALQDSAEQPADESKAATALRRGLAALDMQCQRYLDGLGSANQAASYERQATGLSGGLLSALMGITGSPATHVSSVAAGFSFTSANMDAYTNSYLFADAGKTITRLVKQSQKVFIDNTDFDPTTLDFATTVTILQGYEAVCRPAQIRALVDEAVARSDVAPQNPTPTKAVPAGAAAAPAAVPPAPAAAAAVPAPSALKAARTLRLPVLTVRPDLNQR